MYIVKKCNNNKRSFKKILLSCYVGLAEGGGKNKQPSFFRSALSCREVLDQPEAGFSGVLGLSALILTPTGAPFVYLVVLFWCHSGWWHLLQSSS